MRNGTAEGQWTLRPFLGATSYRSAAPRVRLPSPLSGRRKLPGRRALIATITVDRDMKAALSAGVSKAPQLHEARAASGTPITLHPVAQHKF